MVRMKVDPRVKHLIEQCVAENHRSFFVIIGDHGRDQIVHLHYMLSKAQVSARPSVLWCYKKELGFSSHRQKRMKIIEKQRKKVINNSANLQEDYEQENLFDRFLTTTDIRYCYYKETEKILGNTYGMLILQDFEALTPNLLARTIETVQGGGMVVLLLTELSSLKQLYTLTMDVHARYRKENGEAITTGDGIEEKDLDVNSTGSRFNKRFLLSLADCSKCLVLDDSLNVIPMSSHSRNMLTTSESASEEVSFNPKSVEFGEDAALGKILTLCKTQDQSDSLIEMRQLLLNPLLAATFSLTASRGRGKSASLGLALALAIAYGYSNVFVSSPEPSNIKTLFDFLVKGLGALGLSEHGDYEIISSTIDGETNITRVVVNQTNINNSSTSTLVSRQVIQYLRPEDAASNKLLLSQAELVIIDEAAAIPLTLVKGMLGSYLVFLASTIHGYEGTGRSLSLKLLAQLRTSNEKRLVEKSLETPIRYGTGDAVEHWLNSLLCLDTTPVESSTRLGCPHPDNCQLYWVNRDTLFSYHEESEAFLKALVSLFVSSHYKNSPNDLQLLADGPAQDIFVLLSSDSSGEGLPTILVAVQVAFEGKINQKVVLQSMGRGLRPAGDLIPWTLSQQFQDWQFPELTGIRIIRVATQLGYQRMGYGRKALRELEKYFKGAYVTPDSQADHSIALLSDLGELKPPSIDYLGVSFGLTQGLAHFWSSLNFTPVYIRQSANELTGEHTAIMLKRLLASDDFDSGLGSDSNWLSEYQDDFEKRFKILLSFGFSHFPIGLAMMLLEKNGVVSTNKSSKVGIERTITDLKSIGLTPHDMKRLESYANNQVDYHLILDLIPILAQFYFSKNSVTFEGDDLELDLSPLQRSILLAIGLQRKSIDNLQVELKLDSGTQLLAILCKIVKKFYTFLLTLEKSNLLASSSEHVLERDISRIRTHSFLEPVRLGVDEDLEKSARLASKGQEVSIQMTSHTSLEAASRISLAATDQKVTTNKVDSSFKTLKDKFKKEQDAKLERRLNNKSRRK